MAVISTIEPHGHYIYWCEGCKIHHCYDQRWTFNGDFNKPTFKPSMLVNAHVEGIRCHHFVTNGEIIYLSDCDHELKGKTIKMEEI